MEHTQIFQDRSIRLDQIHYLASLSDAPLSDGLAEFFDDEDAPTQAFAERVPAEALAFFESDDFLSRDDADVVTEWLVDQNLYGFLVHASIPKILSISSNSSTFSWGWCKIRWFYAESFEDVLMKIAAWYDSDREAELQAQGAENDS